MSDLQLAHDLCESEPDEALRLLTTVLRDDPECAPALYLAGCIMCKADKHGLALPLFERAAKLAPLQSEAWNAVGTAYHELHKPVEARQAFKRALDLEHKALYVVNLGVTYADEGNHAEALKWIRKAEKLEPDLPNIPAAAAFSELATGDWANGWKHYSTTLGGKFRKKLNFGAPDWDGSPVGRLILYGEQGLGDEVMYASCIADCRALAREVVIECDPRLEGLYRRSFPWAEVHGTRRLDRDWDTRCDAQASVGSLPALFRSSPEACPRTPYLVADPEKRLMWRALFDSWKKPVIGIAWSGGKPQSQKTRRQVGVDAFRPLMSQIDAEWVSLQYDDPRKEIEASGLPVRFFDDTLKDNDYDKAAAIVSELDYIIGPPTTIHHLAGALGKPSLILVNDNPLWMYHYGDRLPWNEAQLFFRQRPSERWVDTIKRIQLNEYMK